VLLGDLTPGHAALQQALLLYRKLGDARQIATTLSSIAMGLKFEGRLTDARATQLEVLELYRALRDEPNAHITILRLAETEFELGDVEGATLRARENLEQDAVRADASLFANQQSNLAGYLVAADRAEEAQAQALDALHGALDVQNHVFVAFALLHLAALIARSDPECAGRLLGYVDSVFTASGVVRERTEEHSRERAMTMMRESLSGDQIDALIREGAALTEDQAVQLVQAASQYTVGGKV
jgi:tetratricopeptide (TPR) repeat protein